MTLRARVLGLQGAGVALAAALGCVSWGAHPLALGLAPALAFFWALAPTRWGAYLTAFAYYLAVARGLPSGTTVFFGVDASLALGVGLWVASSALLAAPWAAFWPTHRAGYWWRLPAALVAVSVPPLGIFGWGNPLTGAGALFPGLGWAGLLACGLLMIAYGYAVAGQRPARNALAVHLILAVALAWGASRPDPVTDAVGLDTRLSGVGLGRYDFLRAYQHNQELIALAQEQTTDTLLLPESVAGLWQSSTAELWARAERLPGRVFVGAAEPHPGGDYSNAIVIVTPLDHQVVYRQRVPVPVGMWHPWREDSAIAHWRAPGAFSVGRARYGALICYEQLLMWPVLQTYAESPSLVLAPTNAWWSKDTSVPAIQQSVVTAWARLFATPTVSSFNY
ncbi:MAG: nitrilase-related carbon-nitrogen hydrolase [Pseudomonadota bacterium]|nr:nitrilase-related carbon-nitrogen hydrolase [Pseudomonadota bacterium]